MGALKAYVRYQPLSLFGLLAMLVVPCFIVDSFGASWVIGIPIGILLIVLALFVFTKSRVGDE